ncbi:large ribosomal subunit protein mL48-like [Glandiceps talaboti]
MRLITSNIWKTPDLLSYCIPCKMLRQLVRRVVKNGCQQEYVQRLPWLLQQRTWCSADSDDALEGNEYLYPTLNMRVTGHDCTTVEHYAQQLHNLTKCLDVEVSDSYALPTKTVIVSTFQRPGEKRKPANYALKTFERVVQVNDLLATKSSILFEMMQYYMPQGLTVKVEEHTEEHQENRYVKREIPVWMLK